MTAPNTGTRGWMFTPSEWLVETYKGTPIGYKTGGIVFNSAVLPILDEVYPLTITGTPAGSLIPSIGTLLAHADGGTVAGTLLPQQFLVTLVQTGAGTVASEYPNNGTISGSVLFQFLERGS